MTVERDDSGAIIGAKPRADDAWNRFAERVSSARRCWPARQFFSRNVRRGQGTPTVARARADYAHKIRPGVAMDGSILSRLETEWLVACFFGSSRDMPPHVRERLQSVGFVDEVTLTAAGIRWVQTGGPGTVPRRSTRSQDGSGGARPSPPRV